jgi:hypothetical protein
MFDFGMIVNYVMYEVGANEAATTRYDNVFVFRHDFIS